jgi:hypothetical protein
MHLPSHPLIAANSPDRFEDPALVYSTFRLHRAAVAVDTPAGTVRVTLHGELPLLGAAAALLAGAPAPLFDREFRLAELVPQG